MESLGVKDELIPKIATGFGGGIGRTSQICGAVSGAVMALGATFGRNDFKDSKSKDLSYQKVKEFLNKFKDEFNTTICKDLTGCDLDTKEGMERFNKENMHSLVCSEFVSFSAKTVYEMIVRGKM
jgi:C_GCAxxG_C_C family probable redox protein